MAISIDKNTTINLMVAVTIFGGVLWLVNTVNGLEGRFGEKFPTKELMEAKLDGLSDQVGMVVDSLDTMSDSFVKMPALEAEILVLRRTVEAHARAIESLQKE